MGTFIFLLITIPLALWIAWKLLFAIAWILYLPFMFINKRKEKKAWAEADKKYAAKQLKEKAELDKRIEAEQIRMKELRAEALRKKELQKGMPDFSRFDMDDIEPSC